VPLHFTAFHPDYRLTDVVRTPPETCLRACRQARAHGLRYVYAGNIRGGDAECTDCPTCGARLIERSGYAIGAYALDGGHCAACGTEVPGHFAEHGHGRWGRRRLPVRVET
jgi:pyruvate formate lyase activating enzyme